MLSYLTSRLGRVGAIAAFTLLAAVVIPATPAFAAAGEGCPNEAVRAQSNINPATGHPYSQGLPQCRAYEMVSPLDKQAHDATVRGGGPLVSPDGEAVGYVSEGAFAGTENYLVRGLGGPQNTYIARRTANGWATESALVPASVISKPTTYGFNGDASLDLSTLATCGNVDFTAPEGDSPNFACAIRDPDGAWTRTPTYTSLNGEASGNTTIVLGSSSDLSTIVWQPGQGETLLAGDNVPGGNGAIYETTGLGTASPQLRMVSVNNEGTPLTTADGLLGPCLGAAHEEIPVTGSRYQAISSDGNTVYFSAGAGNQEGCRNSTLYARTGDFAGGTPASPTTVEIASDATFQGASADGSKVFFTTTEQLAATDKDSTSDLYMYDFARPPGHQFVQVSAGGLGDPTPGEGAHVEADAYAISSDGSHVYFGSPAVLTTLPNGDGQHASNGSANLYGYDTETEQTQFVGEVGAPTCSISHPDCDRTQVTPDGRYLVFATTTHPSPEDTNGGAAVYRYDFQTGELAWVSHAAPGFTAADEGDDATLPERGGIEANSAMADFGDARRAISENGEYIIFTTAEKLQADDVNGAPDVYEWHNGTVSLISDGQNPAGIAEVVKETEAPGMSASGADIFFATTTRLVGQDTDNLQDIYDARIGGGFPYTAPNPCTSGEACQGAPSGPPSLGSSGSSTFTAGGNLTPGSTSFPPPEETKVKPLTRAQKLAKALTQCKKDKAKAKRKSCEKQARKQYAPLKKAKPKAKN